MVHSTGFEPVTARFVAEYSIQLSYECMWRLINQITSGRCILLLEVIGTSEDLLKPGSFLKLLFVLLQITLKWCTRQDSNL